MASGFFWGILLGGAIGAVAFALMTTWMRRRIATLERRAIQAERLAEIGSLTGGLAHEIKNPLSTVQLNLQLLQEDLLPENPAYGFRPAVWSLVAALFLTGAYNLVNKMPVPKEYHMLFGIKFLLFLHIAAVSILLVKPGTTQEKRARMLRGLVVSGLGVVLISAALRVLGQ